MSGKMKAAALAALIGTGFALGILFASQLNVELHWKSAPTASIASSETKLATQRTINEASRTFVEIAKELTPSVVTVSSTKVFKPSAMRRNFRFRGNPGQGEGGGGGEGEGQGEDPKDFFHHFFDQNPNGDENNNDEGFRQQGLGSGVIVSEDGYILTNNHVIANADEIQVGFEDGRHVPATLVGTDPKSDIAVIKVEAKNLPAVEMGDSDGLEVGEWVLAVGSPFSENLSHSVTAGIISAMGRSYVGLTDYEDYIQTDAAINPGNSGGALVDTEGKVIGINTAIATRTGGSQGVGFAIPINMARNIMDSLIKDGKVTRGWLGVMIQNVTDEIAEARGLTVSEGVIVGDVTSGSPAEKAGLKRGDVIIELNSVTMKSTAQLRNLVARTKPGTRVDLTVLRDRQKKNVSLVLGELKDVAEAEDEEKPVVAEKSVEKLGIEVSAVTPAIQEQYELKSDDGVVVTGVNRGSVAQRYDVREGDVIIEVNSRAVATLRDYRKALDTVKDDEPVMFLVDRRGSTHYVAFKAPAKPGQK